MTSAEVTSKVYSIVSAGLDCSLIHATFTKTNATDFITLDTKYGDTCKWANVTTNAGVVDDATAIAATKVTLSTGTGSMFGLFVVMH